MTKNNREKGRFWPIDMSNGYDRYHLVSDWQKSRDNELDEVVTKQFGVKRAEREIAEEYGRSRQQRPKLKP